MRIDMIGHPFSTKPELAVDIIKLKSAYSKYFNEAVSEEKEEGEVSFFTARALYKTKVDMINFLKNNQDIHWCPNCNYHKNNWNAEELEDPFPDPSRFGSIMRVSSTTRETGYICPICDKQEWHRVEHWD